MCADGVLSCIYSEYSIYLLTAILSLLVAGSVNHVAHFTSHEHTRVPVDEHIAPSHQSGGRKYQTAGTTAATARHVFHATRLDDACCGTRAYTRAL